MRRVKWLIGILGIGAVAAAVNAARSAKRRGAGTIQPVERRAEPDPGALEAMMNGGTRRVGLDLEQIQQLNPDAYQPLVEYLTYIQVQRGDNSTLVFVRDRDIETIAEMLNQTKEEFMERFEKLGVMLSMN